MPYESISKSESTDHLKTVFWLLPKRLGTVELAFESNLSIKPGRMVCRNLGWILLISSIKSIGMAVKSHWVSGTGTGQVSLDNSTKTVGNYSIRHETATSDYYGSLILYLSNNTVVC